ncbi:hypothetical protein APSETT444_009377 [Aspergillus pseudonomiae]
MAPRDIFLVSIRRTTNIRAHFAIWAPSASDSENGSLIEVVGTPMEGFKHQFRRGHAPTPISKKYAMWPIGTVDSAHIYDWPHGFTATHEDPRGDLETTACQVPAPRASENFMAPVNDFSDYWMGFDNAERLFEGK